MLDGFPVRNSHLFSHILCKPVITFIQNNEAMRTLIPLLLLALSCVNGFAQNKQSKEATVLQLQKLLTQERPPTGQKAVRHNTTNLCILKEARNTEIKDNEFTSRIESYISWTQGEINIQNDIFEGDKLKETYTYQVPINAIYTAQLSNCRKNKYGIVDAYAERPLFIYVKKNTTKINHTKWLGNGKAGVIEHHMNNAETDWESIIPLVVDWNRKQNLREDVIAAFSRLTELNQKKVALK